MIMGQGRLNVGDVPDSKGTLTFDSTSKQPTMLCNPV